MPGVNFTSDFGDAVTYDDGSGLKSYHKTGMTAEPLSDSADIDIGNISAYTFAGADINGKSEYSECEHAIIQLPENTFVKTNSQGSWNVIIASAPYAGIVRGWGMNMGGGSIRVNGTVVPPTPAFGNNAKINAWAVNINAGDLLEFYNNFYSGTLTVGLLPVVYPPV